jgi:hypothetical protein
MDRTDGLLLGGLVLVAGSLRRLQDDAIGESSADAEGVASVGTVIESIA